MALQVASKLAVFNGKLQGAPRLTSAQNTVYSAQWLRAASCPKSVAHRGSFPREAIRGLGYKKTVHR